LFLTQDPLVFIKRNTMTNHFLMGSRQFLLYF